MIIVGAGSAGCVLANKIVNTTNYKVLLIEAGPKDNSPIIHIPLGYGMTFYNKKINWIFKPHPAEEWYGGAKMRDLFPESLPNHIKIAEREWNGEDFRKLLDAAVTLHGTTGIEMTSNGKPVLVATKGWYGELGFVVLKDTKESYRNTKKVHIYQKQYLDSLNVTPV